MKTWTEKGIDGQTITRILPENEEDVAKLRKMAEGGGSGDVLDDRESFGDDPDAWKEPDDG